MDGNAFRGIGTLFKLMGWTIVVLLVAVVFLAIKAFAHEGHHVTNTQYMQNVPDYKAQGEFKPGQVDPRETFLYGINRDPDSWQKGKVVNCCKYGGNGDCVLEPVDHVEIVPGGYRVEGEFIPESETTASPDDNYYRCKHSWSPASHCFFAPPSGM
jgi:hypothetical protein